MSKFDCYVCEKEPFLRKALSFIDMLLYSVFRKNINTSKIKKILILRQDRIGDLVATTPIFRAIKEKFPNSELHVMINPGNFAVIRKNPFIDKIICKSIGWFDYSVGHLLVKRAKDFLKSFFDGSFFSLLKEVRNEKYDLIIDGVVKKRNGLLCLLSGAKYTIGNLFFGSGFIFSQRVKVDRNENYVYQVYDLLKPLGIVNKPSKVEIFFDEKYTEEKETLLKKLKIDKNKIKIGIHVGCSNVKARQWKKENWIELIKNLRDINNCQIILTGMLSEKELIKEILKEVVDSADMREAIGLNLEDFIIFLSALDVIVCVESGTMHLAAACNIPTVVLFNGENPQIWTPFGNLSKILRKLDGTTCYNSDCSNPLCINAISPVEVEEAARQLLCCQITYK